MSVTNPNAYYVLQGMGSPTLQSLFGSRMFFNLKEAGERGVNAGTNFPSYTLTNMNFNEGQQNPKSGESSIFLLRSLTELKLFMIGDESITLVSFREGV